MNRMPLAFLVSLLIAACADRGSGAKPMDDARTDGTGRHTGTVTNAFAGEGCPWLIILEAATEVGPLIPIALDERYLRDGTRISFTYRLSRASSGACAKGTPAILEDISLR